MGWWGGGGGVEQERERENASDKETNAHAYTQPSSHCTGGDDLHSRGMHGIYERDTIMPGRWFILWH